VTDILTSYDIIEKKVCFKKKPARGGGFCIWSVISMPRKKKTYSDQTKELARARVAAGDPLSQVAREMGIAKSTLHGWLTQADRDGFQAVREQRKERFIQKAWDAIEKYLEHLMTEKVIKAAAAHNATTVIGTLYDKIALASGDVTTRGEVRGQVTQRYEYDITQRIITDPETAKLADQLLQRTANSDTGMVRTHSKPWDVAAVQPPATAEPEDT